MTPHPAFVGAPGLAGCVLAGVLAGAASALLTAAVYASEDAFARLPIHWMWWPAIGGAVVGAGGLLFPQALGVGYDTIGALLAGDVAGRTILGILIVKALIWSVSLGSGTSGGVLAPLLMIGGALGGVEAWVLPDLGPGFWPLISMAAMLGGTMRAPFTGILFAVELTHDVNMLLPLLIAVSAAHAFTVLLLKRSILTEKIARRGFHVSREYAIDPLEILFAREVMRTSLAALPDRRADGEAGGAGPRRPAGRAAAALSGGGRGGRPCRRRDPLRPAPAGRAGRPRIHRRASTRSCDRRPWWRSRTNRCGSSPSGWRTPA